MDELKEISREDKVRILFGVKANKFDAKVRMETIKDYKKQWAGLQKIRTDLNVSAENLKSSERYPEYNDELFKNVSTEDIKTLAKSIAQTIDKYISEQFVESWMKTIDVAFEDEVEINDRKNYLKILLKMEPLATYKAMSRSCDFLRKLEESKGNRSAYQRTLNEISKYCSEVTTTADVVNDLEFVTSSKYHGVIKAVTIGLEANPLTKNPNNVKDAYRAANESALKKVFSKRDKEECVDGPQPGEE